MGTTDFPSDGDFFGWTQHVKTCGSSPADSGLAEDVAVERAEGEADVGLREAQLDPPLLELLGERLQVI